MKQLVLDMSNNNTAKQRTSAEGDKRGSANKLSSLFKCHLSRIVKAESVWVSQTNCVCVRDCTLLSCRQRDTSTHKHRKWISLHSNTTLSIDNTTISLCLKVCLVSLSLPLTGFLLSSVWVWLNTSHSLFYKNYIRPLERQNGTENYNPKLSGMRPARKHLLRSGVDVN